MATTKAHHTEIPAEWWGSSVFPRVLPSLLQWALQQPPDAAIKHPNALWLLLALDRLGWDPAKAHVADVCACPGYGPEVFDLEPKELAQCRRRQSDVYCSMANKRTHTPHVDNQLLNLSTDHPTFRRHLPLHTAQYVVRAAATAFVRIWRELRAIYYNNDDARSSCVYQQASGFGGADVRLEEAPERLTMLNWFDPTVNNFWVQNQMAPLLRSLCPNEHFAYLGICPRYGTVGRPPRVADALLRQMQTYAAWQHREHTVQELLLFPANWLLAIGDCHRAWVVSQQEAEKLQKQAIEHAQCVLRVDAGRMRIQGAEAGIEWLAASMRRTVGAAVRDVSRHLQQWTHLQQSGVAVPDSVRVQRTLLQQEYVCSWLPALAQATELLQAQPEATSRLLADGHQQRSICLKRPSSLQCSCTRAACACWQTAVTYATGFLDSLLQARQAAAGATTAVADADSIEARESPRADMASVWAQLQELAAVGARAPGGALNMDVCTKVEHAIRSLTDQDQAGPFGLRWYTPATELARSASPATRSGSGGGGGGGGALDVQEATIDQVNSKNSHTYGQRTCRNEPSDHTKKVRRTMKQGDISILEEQGRVRKQAMSMDHINWVPRSLPMPNTSVVSPSLLQLQYLVQLSNNQRRVYCQEQLGRPAGFSMDAGVSGPGTPKNRHAQWVADVPTLLLTEQPYTVCSPDSANLALLLTMCKTLHCLPRPECLARIPGVATAQAKTSNGQNIRASADLLPGIQRGRTSGGVAIPLASTQSTATTATSGLTSTGPGVAGSWLRPLGRLFQRSSAPATDHASSTGKPTGPGAPSTAMEEQAAAGCVSTEAVTMTCEVDCRGATDDVVRACLTFVSHVTAVVACMHWHVHRNRAGGHLLSCLRQQVEACRQLQQYAEICPQASNSFCSYMHSSAEEQTDVMESWLQHRCQWMYNRRMAPALHTVCHEWKLGGTVCLYREQGSCQSCTQYHKTGCNAPVDRTNRPSDDGGASSGGGPARVDMIVVHGAAQQVTTGQAHDSTASAQVPGLSCSDGYSGGLFDFVLHSTHSVPDMLRSTLQQMKMHEECSSFLLLLDWFSIVPIRLVACSTLYQQADFENLVVQLPRGLVFIGNQLQVYNLAVSGRQLAERHTVLAEVLEQPIRRLMCTEYLLGFCGCLG